MSELTSPANSLENSQLAISYGQIWDKWGDAVGMKKRDFSQLWDFATEQYNDLPFHNFNHATEALSAAMSYSDICEANDIQVSRRALSIATLLHDAGYIRDHVELGFKTHEEYAASIQETFMSENSYPKEEIIFARNILMATSLGVKPKTTEEKIMVRSDLSNIGCDYRTFKDKTSLLRDENKILLGKNYSERKFIANSAAVLISFVSNDLSLGKFDTSNWTRDAW